MTHAIHDHAAPEWAAARAALDELEPPPELESALVQAFARRHARRRTGWKLAGLTSWLSLGAVAGMAALLVVGVQHSPAPAVPAPLSAPLVADSGFVPVAGLDGAQLAAADSHLMSTALSRSTLVAMGIPIADNAPDELIRADLLVAASGEPLAVRLSLN